MSFASCRPVGCTKLHRAKPVSHPQGWGYPARWGLNDIDELVPKVKVVSNLNANQMNAKPSVTAIVLAAGCSTRMVPGNKLLADIEGKPMLHRTLDAIDRTNLQQVMVVTGFQSDQIEESIAQHAVEIVHNPCYLEGLSTSLRAGITALPDSTSAAMIFLADMPGIIADVPNRLFRAHLIARDKICVPIFSNKRGNPVLWPRQFFGELSSVKGDIGGRHLIRKLSGHVQEVPVYSNSIFHDIDTLQDLKALYIRR